MKRREVCKLLGALPLTGIAAVSANGAKPGGQGLYRVSGNVLVNGKPAKEGTLIRPGDTVVTGPGSEAVFVVGQDAYRQRGNSTVALLGDTIKGGLRVLSGGLLSVFAKGERQIVTPSATIGIRGTGCYIEAEGYGLKARTYFCLCYGSADLTPTAAPRESESYTTRHHDKPMYIHNDTGMAKMMVPAGVINHTDQELDLLEALVGRSTPFSGLFGESRY